jgi:hypothetical protein
MLPVWWAYLGLELWPIGNAETVKPSVWLVAAMFLTSGVIDVLIFTTMRRRNGYAGWHDLASGTRVISRRKDESRTTVISPPIRRRRFQRIPFAASVHSRSRDP